MSREKLEVNVSDNEIKSVYCRFYDKPGSFKQKLGSWIENKSRNIGISTEARIYAPKIVYECLRT